MKRAFLTLFSLFLIAVLLIACGDRKTPQGTPALPGDGQVQVQSYPAPDSPDDPTSYPEPSTDESGAEEPAYP